MSTTDLEHILAIRPGDIVQYPYGSFFKINAVWEPRDPRAGGRILEGWYWNQKKGQYSRDLIRNHWFDGRPVPRIVAPDVARSAGIGG